MGIDLLAVGHRPFASAITSGTRVRPNSVTSYSTRGGTSAKAVRTTRPSSTRCLSVWVSINGLLQLTEPLGAGKQCADHQQGPLVADPVLHLADRAAIRDPRRTVGPACDLRHTWVPSLDTNIDVPFVADPMRTDHQATHKR